ncbi:MAG TPA: dickkopf-related protein [Xanthobacteraceae bacterium]|nr:dickkopf-related protein [Xanthobacteraceae bacterium]
MTSHRTARAFIALALLTGLAFHLPAPARAQGSDIAWSNHANLGVNCGPSGCIASGPGCDTRAVPGQCSFPKDKALALCAGHPTCVAVTCNPGRSDCQARDTAELTPMSGFMSYVMWTHYADLAVNCPPSGCLRTGPHCDTQAVPNQCSFARDDALELCAGVPGCVAVNCNTGRKDCQARDSARLDPWKGMESYIRGRPTGPGADATPPPPPPPAVARLLDTGQSCAKDSQCRSGNCEYHGSKGYVCAVVEASPPPRPAAPSLREIGQSCSDNLQCGTGFCEYHGSKGYVCAVMEASPPPRPAAPKLREIGQSCTDNLQCGTGFCEYHGSKGTVCAVKPAAAERCREAGRSCQSGVQCCTGMCDRNNVCVTH